MSSDEFLDHLVANTVETADVVKGIREILSEPTRRRSEDIANKLKEHKDRTREAYENPDWWFLLHELRTRSGPSDYLARVARVISDALSRGDEMLIKLATHVFYYREYHEAYGSPMQREPRSLEEQETLKLRISAIRDATRVRVRELVDSILASEGHSTDSDCAGSDEAILRT
jgi:hypothetical protein